MSTEVEVKAAGRLMTVASAAAALGIGKTKLYVLMDAGELPYVKLGKLRRIDPADLEELVSRSRVPARAARKRVT
jgi:excisionase family DNA binding protein